MAVRITCISKDGGNHENPYVAISHLGWINEETKKQGNSTRLEIYEWITSRGGDAYVQVGSARARLIAELSPRGNPYVKTVADDTRADNLLKLPECR